MTVATEPDFRAIAKAALERLTQIEREIGDPASPRGIATRDTLPERLLAVLNPLASALDEIENPDSAEWEAVWSSDPVNVGYDHFEKAGESVG